LCWDRVGLKKPKIHQRANQFLKKGSGNYLKLRNVYHKLRIMRFSLGYKLSRFVNWGMNESLLHFIWKNRLLEAGDWRTTEGQTIRVFQTGQHNHHAGPDFNEALLGIGLERWMGSVEIHWYAKEWWQHGHQNDAAYNNVILHVVWEGTQPAQRADGSLIPTFELKNWVAQEMLLRYESLQFQNNPIPCSRLLRSEDAQLFGPMLDRAGVERLEHRVSAMEQQLIANKGDWEQAFWVWLAGVYGLKVNREPMEALAQSVPVHLLLKYQQDLMAVEALLFGQAGFLEQPTEEAYLKDLKQQYQYLRQKHRLKPHYAAAWRFLRMRPGGFPTRRIAQLATLVHQNLPLFQKMRSQHTIKTIMPLLLQPPSTYWQHHYRPGDNGKGKSGVPSQAMAEVWIINALVPAVFLYGKLQHQPEEQEKAINWLEELRAEENNVLHLYAPLGVKPANALQSQGIIELYKHYCSEQRCLDCSVGCKLLTRKQTKHAKTG